MVFEHLLLEKTGSVAVLSINRPESLNALNSKVLDELSDALDLIAVDEEINVLIVTGKGRAFVAGADISEMQNLNSEGARAFADKGIRAFRKMELLDKPSIAAVNGFALGGGCELSMACDIRIASSKAKFGQPEVGLGITPGFGGTNRLARLIGLSKAKELIFTGDTINAVEAERIGLVSYITEPDELMDQAMALAEKIASNAQLAVRYSKNAINRSFEVDIETGMEIEKNLFGLCFATYDQKEGMNAFLGKRKPEYKTK